MIDTRAVGQDLQVQVLDAARKGRERVASTIKTVTATAQHIGPQLATLPRPSLTRPTLPTPAQLRETAAKLPTPAQLMAGAQDLAGHARAVGLLVIEQVRIVAAPLAQQASARLAKVGAQPAAPRTSTRVTGIQVNGATSENGDTATASAKRAETPQQKAKPKPKATTK